MFSQRQRPISAPVLRGHLTKAGETARWVLREGEASSISAQGTSLGSSPSPVTSLLGKLSWSVSSLNQKLLHVCCYEGQRRTEDAENCPPLGLLQLKYKALSSLNGHRESDTRRLRRFVLCSASELLSGRCDDPHGEVEVFRTGVDITEVTPTLGSCPQGTGRVMVEAASGERGVLG